MPLTAISHDEYGNPTMYVDDAGNQVSAWDVQQQQQAAITGSTNPWVRALGMQVEDLGNVSMRHQAAIDFANALGVDPEQAAQWYTQGMQGNVGSDFFAGATDQNNRNLMPAWGMLEIARQSGAINDPRVQAYLREFADRGNTEKDIYNAQESATGKAKLLQFGTMLAGLAGGGFMGAFDTFNPLGTVGAAETSPIVAEMSNLALPEAVASAADPIEAMWNAGVNNGMTFGEAAAAQGFASPEAMWSSINPSWVSAPSGQGLNATKPEGLRMPDGQSQGFKLSAEAANASPIGQTASGFGADPVTASQASTISSGASGAVQGTPESFMDKLKNKAIEKGASKALDYFMRPAYDYTGTGAARVDNGYSAAGINPFKQGNLQNLFGGDIDAITAEAERQLGFAVGRQGLQQSSVEGEGKQAIDTAEQGYKAAVDDANKTAEQLFNEQQQQTKAYGDQLAAAGYGEDQITQALGSLPDSADAYVAEPDLPDFSMIDLVARGGSPLPSRKKKRTSGASAATPGEDTEDYGGAILRT